MTIHRNPIFVALSAALLAVACMVPPANQGTAAATPVGDDGHAGSAPASGGGGCGDYCAYMGQCGILAWNGMSAADCATACESRWNDRSQAEIDEILATDCDTIQASLSGGGDGGDVGYGGGGGGGDGQGCAMSHASQPVQDCPSGQECCGSKCWTRGMCAMPTGN